MGRFHDRQPLTVLRLGEHVPKQGVQEHTEKHGGSRSVGVGLPEWPSGNGPMKSVKVGGRAHCRPDYAVGAKLSTAATGGMKLAAKIPGGID